MESLGGVGYLENEDSQHINVARLYRDANVLSIWEGTTNVLGTDFVRTFKGQNGEKTLKALRAWLNHALFSASPQNNTGLGVVKSRILGSFQAIESEIAGSQLEELIVRARELMDTFAAIVIGALMIADVERDGDPVSAEVFKRFAKTRGFGEPYEGDWVTQTVWDSKIVFGEATEKAILKPRM